MDKTFVNIFNGIGDKNTSKKMSILDIIWGILEGRWEPEITTYRNETNKKHKEYLKMNLQAATFSGTLSGNRRLDSNIDNYTGVIVCDIDERNSIKLNQYKKKLSKDNHVIAFFESPSKGLKVLFQVNSPIKYHKTHAFVQIEQYMKKTHNIKIDPSGKNPSRLCFISWDPNLHYNDSFDIFSIDTTIDYEELEISSAMESVKHLNKNFETSTDSRFVFDKVVRWVSESKTGRYYKGNKNTFVFALSCRLSEAGLSQDIALGMIFERYPSTYEWVTKVKRTVRSAYNHTSGVFGSKPVRQRKSKQRNIF